jgi:hypothetical protein
MRYAITTVAVFALLASAHADEFHLRDATGKKYGPFEFKQGEALSIAGQEYTISKVLTKEQQILEKMKAIIIPEIDFRQANVHDVIDFLQYASVEFDPKSEHRQRGVSSILNLGTPSATPAATTDPFEADPFAEPPGGQHQTADVPLITFSARHVSLFEAMNIVCKVCNLQWAIQDGVVMIEPKKNAEEVQQPDRAVTQEPAPSAAP